MIVIWFSCRISILTYFHPLSLMNFYANSILWNIFFIDDTTYSYYGQSISVEWCFILVGGFSLNYLCWTHICNSTRRFSLGRECKEEINECLDASLNDCDPMATCHDMKEGYTCACPIKFRDDSPDRNKPGRKCFAVIIPFIIIPSFLSIFICENIFVHIFLSLNSV